MKLFYLPGACSLADHIVLEWAGADYNIVAMDSDSIKSAKYLALNAGGNVPLLQDGDFTLTENVAILYYLAEMYPSAHLFGGETLRSRADCMRWLAFLNSDVHNAFKPLFANRHAGAQDPFDELLAPARHRIRGYLERLERQLEGRDWIVGSRSIADPYLFVIYRWATVMEIDLDGLKHLHAFAERMHADSSVRTALFAEEGNVI